MPSYEEQLISILNNSKKGSELPVGADLSATDKFIYFDIANGRIEAIPKSVFEAFFTAGNQTLSEVFLGTVTTAGATTTSAEITTFINAQGFTITTGNLKLLKVNVFQADVVYTRVYAFKAGTPGTYGNAGTAIVFSDILEVSEKPFNVNLETTSTIALGDIGASTIEDYINANNDPSWDLLAGTIYIFDAVISSVAQSYLYVGTQPSLIGNGNNAVTAGDFKLIESDGTTGNVGTFEGLTDTLWTSLADDQIPVYDSGSGKWLNETITADGGEIT